ncbi:MAG: aspartate dehydrogenase [Candidatus Methanomethylophilaceae archaeon]|nr:aspartate dehydrogenase [Candidatus Methanomethylophilaceae archaeon]MBR4685417.1 aspartate dehydrogenase [Candidatus Methanomethylophilaceae archaeon]
MRITIVGCGSRGSKLAEAADKMMEVKRIYLVDTDKKRAEAVAASLNKAELVEDVEEELYHCDLVIECATQDAAKTVIPKVVSRGVDIMIMSVGALVDDEFRAMVTDKASQCDAKIYIPSGAICGTDGLRSSTVGAVQEVELITTMPPLSFECIKYVEDKGVDVKTIKDTTVLFKGTAREAVQYFPRNVNVAAIVSIMGIGFDKTMVTIQADPAIKTNSHELRIKGEFGEMTTHTFNVPSPINPRTSNLSVFSAISALQRIVRNEWIGI